MENLAALLGQQGGPNPIAALRERAASLSQRGEALKKLADAWQPLYETLDANQKQRLRLAAAYVLHEVREAMESRRMQDEDEDED